VSSEAETLSAQSMSTHSSGAGLLPSISSVPGPLNSTALPVALWKKNGSHPYLSSMKPNRSPALGRSERLVLYGWGNTQSFIFASTTSAGKMGAVSPGNGSTT
jgi:hypothetical protein